jgi:hypothetical protein
MMKLRGAVLNIYNETALSILKFQKSDLAETSARSTPNLVKQVPQSASQGFD